MEEATVNIKVHVDKVYTTDALRRSSRLGNEDARLVCGVNVPELNTTVAGTNTGGLLVWRPRANPFSANGVDLAGEQICIELLGQKHQGPVRCMVYTRPSCCTRAGLVVTGGSDRYINVWDPWFRASRAADAPVQRIRRHRGTVLTLAWGRDRLISAGSDNTLRIWKVLEGDPYPRFCPCQVIDMSIWVTAINTNDGVDGKMFLVGDSNGHVTFFGPEQQAAPMVTQGLAPRTLLDSKGSNTTSMSSIESDTSFKFGADTMFTLHKRQKLHRLSLTTIEVAEKENMMITISNDHTMQVHDIATGAALFGVDNPTECRYTAAAWNTAGRTPELILVDEKGHIQIWDTTKEECLFMKRIKTCGIYGLELLEDGRVQIFTAESVEIWGIARERKMQEYTGHEGPILAMVLMEPKALPDPETSFWSRLPKPSTGEPPAQPSEHDRDVANAERELLAMDYRLYTAAADMRLLGWDLPSMDTRGEFGSHPSEVSALAFVPDTHFIVSGHQSGEMLVWNLDSGSAHPFGKHGNAVTDFAVFLKDARSEYLLSCSYDGAINIFVMDRRTQTDRPYPGFSLDRRLEVSDKEVLCVAIVGDQIYFGGNFPEIRTLETREYTSQKSFLGHNDSVTDLATDGHFLLSSSEDGTVRVWDLETSLCMRTLSRSYAHNPIQTLGFIKSSGYLIACSEREICIWDYVLGSVVHSIPSERDDAFLSVLPTQQLLYVGTRRSKILKFTLPAECLLDAGEDDDSEDHLADSFDAACALEIFKTPTPSQDTTRPETPYETRVQREIKQKVIEATRVRNPRPSPVRGSFSMSL